MAYILTGARRIGFYIVKRMLEDGKDVAIVYNHQNHCEKLKKAFCIKKDLSKEDASDIPKIAYEHFGKIDGFLHMASPYYKTDIQNFDLKEYRYHNAIIVEAFISISIEAFKIMMKNDGHIKGHILAFGDWAIMHTPYKNYLAYFVAKAGLHGAVITLAKEFAPHVLVNALALGPVLKPEDMQDEEWQSIIKNSPLQKEVSLEDIYETTKMFINTTSITGAILPIDSGRHIKGVNS